MANCVNLARVLGCALAFANAGSAQRGAGDWMTSGFDAQRSSWIRADPKINADLVAKGGFKFLWKAKFDQRGNRPNAITPPLSLAYYIGYRGFRSFAFSSGGADNVFAVDTDLGRPEWEKRFEVAAGGACAPGLTANLARSTVTTFPATPAGSGGAGRGTAAKSTVGEPNQGAAVLAEIAARSATLAAARPLAPTASGNVLAPAAALVHAIASDGKLHSMYLSSGEEPQPAVEFLPPNAKAHGLTVTGGFAYAASAPDCGAAPKGIWAIDLASKRVVSWEAPAGIAGSAGPAFGPDGTLYVTTADGQMAALAAKTLEQKSVYKSGGVYKSDTTGFATSPVVFQFKGKVLVAAAAKDGGIHVVEAGALEMPAAKTEAADKPSTSAPAGLASWQDATGTRWILMAAGRAISAWKLVEQNGALSLVRGWTSREMDSPGSPIIVNGVVFAVSGSARAVLYAFDGASGKDLWNSGTTIAASIAPNGGVSAGNSQIYVAAKDGNIYAFGPPMEH